jgi:sec-independent protein translocase protein TatA
VKYLLIMFIILLLFGGSRLPNLARGLGSGIRNFRDSLKGDDSGDPKKP